MQISKNIVNGLKSNNYVLVGIRAIVCVQKPSYHFLQTLHRMFKIVFRDSTLYPKQLSLFCLLRLISASAERIGYISNFCSKDISAASFCSGKLLGRSDECVLLPCFNAQPDIFAVDCIYLRYASLEGW